LEQHHHKYNRLTNFSDSIPSKFQYIIAWITRLIEDHVACVVPSNTILHIAWTKLRLSTLIE
jgi:hypothetical protein